MFTSARNRLRYIFWIRVNMYRLCLDVQLQHLDRITIKNIEYWTEAGDKKTAKFFTKQHKKIGKELDRRFRRRLRKALSDA